MKLEDASMITLYHGSAGGIQIMTEFNDKIEHWFADSIGKCFAMSVKDGYDSYMFSKEFLSSDWGSGSIAENSRAGSSEPAPFAYSLVSSTYTVQIRRISTLFGSLPEFRISFRILLNCFLFALMRIVAFEEIPSKALAPI